MFRNSVARSLRTAHSALSPLRPSQAIKISSISKRFASSSNSDSKDKKKEDRAINFRNFISVGIISSILLTQVVDAVNKEKPRNKSMSESEYFRQQQRLKRKKTLFEPTEKEIYFLKTEKEVQLNEIEGFTIIDPKKLVEAEKADEKSRFHALLNDPDTVELPRGLVVDLIGQSLKAKPDGKFIILNYPNDVKESIQFEDKIVTINKLIYLNENENVNDVVKYYNTVNKTLEIKSLKELNDALKE